MACGERLQNCVASRITRFVCETLWNIVTLMSLTLYYQLYTISDGEPQMHDENHQVLESNSIKMCIVLLKHRGKNRKITITTVSLIAFFN